MFSLFRRKKTADPAPAVLDPAEAPAKPLPVLYSEDIEATMRIVADAGGTIVRPIFSFPGGRRFHFTDPAGNELAVWGA